jgi:flagellar assembly protein FliH
MSSSFEFPQLTVPRPAADTAAAAEEERLAALEAARQDGFAAGLAAGRAEIGPAAEALAAATRELEGETARAADAAERAAAELALQIAEKVLGAALEVKPELVLKVVRGALRRLTEPLESILMVNPADAERVRGALDELAGEHGAGLTVRAERRVAPGGCVVRTKAGEVDAGIAGQLERAGAVVAQELAG